MSIESDIKTEIYKHLRSYKTSTLSYVKANGWFKSRVENIPLAQLPSVSMWVANAGPINEESDRVFEFSMDVLVRGSIINFDIQGSARHGGITIEDFYADLDKALFSMIPREEKTVLGTTSFVKMHPILPDVGDFVRDVKINQGQFSSETFNDDFPNLDVIIPIEIRYYKTISERLLT